MALPAATVLEAAPPMTTTPALVVAKEEPARRAHFKVHWTTAKERWRVANSMACHAWCDQSAARAPRSWYMARPRAVSSVPGPEITLATWAVDASSAASSLAQPDPHSPTTEVSCSPEGATSANDTCTCTCCMVETDEHRLFACVARSHTLYCIRLVSCQRILRQRRRRSRLHETTLRNSTKHAQGHRFL